MSYLLTKWRHVLDGVFNIPTWTEALTLAYLAELASRSTTIIECGTYLGASAKAMLLANPRLKLYCIDTFACQGEAMMLAYLKSQGATKGIEQMTTYDICRHYTLRDEFNAGRCTLISGDSRAGSQNLAQFVPNGTIDAVWIDDGHAEEDVLRDIVCLMPFLKPGGEMVGHDYDGDNDVARGVQMSGIKFDVPVPRMWRSIVP